VRGSLALVLTAGGLALLLGFRQPSDPASAMKVALGTTSDPSPVPGSEVSGAPTSGLAAGTEASAAANTEASAAASPAAEPTDATRTATGQAFQFRYGIVQVKVTTSGDQIVSIEALQMPDRDRHSASISRQVEPMLRERAMAVDSAGIDVVSGATYTSLAYAYSLQSALDQLTA
jgi:uncharacterized protein with FMN-binding domain